MELDQIKIEGLEIFATHGVFPEENVLGQKFIVSATLYTDTRKARKTHEPTASIHYGEVSAFITEFVKSHTYKLLERVAEELVEDMLQKFDGLEKVTLEIQKPWAPVGLPLKTVSVRITRSWHTAYIALGSNMGDSRQILDDAVSAIDALPASKVEKVSGFITTPPYGVTDQPDFLNGCLRMKTLYYPRELLRELNRIEKEAGRERIIHWGPRTLDLDIIFYDDLISQEDDLCIPHVEMHKRSFVLEPLEERLTGRFVVDPVIDPNSGEVLMEPDRMMTEEDAKRIVDAGIESVKIRSLITCKSHHGVCCKCYGANLAFNEPVQVGEAVGIIAAQSIGEPGTQLTMRTFHTGGVAGGADITQGLPRVEELFEARKPKQLAILSEIDGVVHFEEIKKSRHAIVTGEDGEEKKYLIPYGARLCEHIVEGAHVKKGEELTLGAVNPHDVLAILGEEAVYNYLIKEVQFAYRTQGVDINDKHIEVIVRQMLKKCTVDDAGDTDLVSGTMVDVAQVDEANEAIDKRIALGETTLKHATYIPILMGITKASLATDSFLSAASFQETTRVLTDAAIKGKVDPLIGLKENVIIGKLVPAGTGMQVFDKVDVVPSYFSAEGSEEILNLEQLQELLTNSMSE